MGEKIGEIVEMIPHEIRRGVDAFSGENEQAIMVTLLNEQQLTFSDLQRETELHSQSLTNALKKLRRAGLIRKRSDGDFEKERAHYEASEYGERFVDCLLNSLGSVDGFEGHENRFEVVDHIHSPGPDNVLVERYAYKTEGTNQAGMISGMR